MPAENVPEVRIAELEADNKRLRGLLDQKDAPGELRHRLRSTLAMLRSIIRRTAETSRDVSSFAGHVEDRLDALMRVHAAVDTNGSLDIHQLLTDELLHYGTAEGPRLLLDGPVVMLQPRAAQVLGMAIHELAVNAVEFGPLGANQGLVDVRWSTGGTPAGAIVTLTWKETGPTSPIEPSKPGFGTEVLTRMLNYELKAETSLTIRPEGLLYRIDFPLEERIGWVQTL